MDYNAVASFVDKWTDAGFTSSTNAYSQGYMKFWGTDGDEITTVYLSYKNSPLDHRDGEVKEDYWWPFSTHTLTANANIPVGGPCDYGASGHTSHHIWNSAMNPVDGSTMTWSDHVVTSDAGLVAQQPRNVVDTTTAAPGSTGGDTSDGSGGTIYVICYWTNYYDYGVLVEHEDDGCQVL